MFQGHLTRIARDNYSSKRRANQTRLGLGQIAVADKSNEITAMPQRLHLPDIRGRIITADSRNLLITSASLANSLIMLSVQ